MAQPRPWRPPTPIVEPPLGRDELVARIALEVRCEQLRARRVLAVHLLALAGIGLMALLQGAAPGRWQPFIEETWGLCAAGVALFGAMELSVRRKLSALSAG